MKCHVLANTGSEIFGCDVFQLCLAVQKTSLLSGTRTAIRGTLLQMISNICYQLHDKKSSCAATIKSQLNARQSEAQMDVPLCTGCNKAAENEEITEEGYHQTESNQFSAELESHHFVHAQQKGMNLLRNDVIETLKYLVTKVESFQESSNSSTVVLNSQKLELCLDSLLTGLRCLPNSINCSPQFLEFVWQNLCPTLISILGNPRNLKTVSNAHEASENVATGSSKGSIAGPVAGGSSAYELGRGSGVSSSPPNMIGSNAR